ncbi:fibronectin type III-like domain-contianing protein [Streptomyces iranensis]|uniref:fibronectin type III-like domain-contianing protein n=1 Tax=Streptomyces iranensis TaxID=576784 RepID=UPI0039B75C70
MYVGPSPDLPLDQAERSLAGFRRIHLRPGQAREVTVRVAGRVLSSWDSSAMDGYWAPGAGPWKWAPPRGTGGCGGISRSATGPERPRPPAHRATLVWRACN